MSKDKYIEDVIRRGDEGSELLAGLCAPTLRNSELVDVVAANVGDFAVLRIPTEYYCIVHSAAGKPEETDLGLHTRTMVDHLMGQAMAISATPVGFANVIDSSSGERSMLETVADSMVRQANSYSLAILNGENAILGLRIKSTANVSGTMISIIKKDAGLPIDSVPGTFNIEGNNYAVFDPEGKQVFINSDGVGTKTEFYERAGSYNLALHDSLAMKLDDAVKIGATAKVVSDVVETKGNIPFSELERHASLLGQAMGIQYILQREDVGDRLFGYSKTAPAYNISGSAVSVIDENRLQHPLVSSPGETLLVITGKQNPRSNGITSKRETMLFLGQEWCKKHAVNEWHHTPEGKRFLEYLAEPSTILYSVFKMLADEDFATSFYHMSGGAFNGKLARPLAQRGLYVKLENLFQPHWTEYAMIGASGISVRDAYAKWPMGNDGFVSTSNVRAAQHIIKDFRLDVREVGVLQAADTRTGVSLTTFNGKKIHFSGA